MFTRRRHLLAIAGLAYRGPARRDAPTDNPADGTTGGGGTTDTGAGDGKADGQGDGDAKTPKIDGDFDPERAARSLAAAREAERKAKERAQTSDARLTSVLKALGITSDGKADPEEQVKALSARAEAAEQRATQLAIRDAVRTAAAKHNGDAELLLDSQRFLTKLTDIDATAADFDDKVADMVKAEVKANPRYAANAAGQGPGKQGADINGGGGGQKSKPKNLTEAITARLAGG